MYYLLFLSILHTRVLHIYEAIHYFVSVKIVSCLFNMQRYKVSVITVINCRFSHASFFRTSSQNTWKRPIKPLLQPPKLHAPTRSYPRDSCNYGTALGFDFKSFFPGCIAMQHTSRLPSPSINGTWKVWSVVAAWASQIYDMSSFKYLPAFMNKTHKEKENVSLWLGLRYSCYKYVAGNCDFRNSVWCCGSISSPSGIW